MKTKRMEGKLYRQLEVNETTRAGDRYVCENCGQLHNADAGGVAGRARYFREVEPMVAAMIAAKEKHGNNKTQG